MEHMEHIEPVDPDEAKELFKKVRAAADAIPPPEPPPYPGVDPKISDDVTNMAHSARLKRKPR